MYSRFPSQVPHKNKDLRHYLRRPATKGPGPATLFAPTCDGRDKPGAAVIEKAARYGVPAFVFSPKDYASKADYETEIVRRLDEADVCLVCLAGYMRIVGDVLLQAYDGRIVNIHPSLLPAFRGAHAVEQALL